PFSASRAGALEYAALLQPRPETRPLARLGTAHLFFFAVHCKKERASTCWPGCAPADHQTFIPPSTTRSTPVTHELSSEARNKATFATSSGRPRRPSSVLAEHRARPFGVLQLFLRLIGFNQARGDGIRANTVFSPLHRELPRHPDDPCLGRRMRQ